MQDRTWRRKILSLTLRWKIMEIEKEGENALVSNLFKMNTYMASRDLERSYKRQFMIARNRHYLLYMLIQLLIIIVANCSI